MDSFFRFMQRLRGLAVLLVFMGASFLFFLLPVHTAHAATYTVTTTANAGAGSLRQAITDANTSLGTDTIVFDDAVGGGTITLSSILPTITESTIIDGTTLTSVQAGPDITIIGSGDAEATLYFFNADAGSVVKGVALDGSGYCLYAVGTEGLTVGGSGAGDANWINGCTSGIKLEYDDSTSVFGNNIGVQSANAYGINSIGSTNLTIGSASAGDRNIIANNTVDGIDLADVADVTVRGNWIGTADGSTDNGNTGWGIACYGTGDTVAFGGTAAGAGNVISGNNAGGLLIWNTTFTATTIQGNYIGVNSAGNAALGNTSVGIQTGSAVTIGGTASGAGNVISGNGTAQIYINDAGATLEVENLTGSTIQGNIIGLNADGDAIIDGNDGYGIQIQNSNNTIGGTAAGARNIISGNSWHGVLIQGDFAIGVDNVIKGNYIGVDITGEVDLGNGDSGIYVGTNADNTVIGGTAAGAGNLISGNGTRGIIFVTNTGGTVEGNIVGLDVDGNTDLGNAFSGLEIQANNVMVGGTTTASRNIFSGNTHYGVAIVAASSGVSVLNNYIGTDIGGTLALGNDASGVLVGNTASDNVIGAASQGNVIADSGEHGIYISEATAEDTIIYGNYIGIDTTGAAGLGNTAIGIVNAGTRTIIGGTTSGQGNVISGNGNLGILLGGTAGGALVQGNKVGINAAGTAVIANVSDGIQLTSSDNTIGGTTASARNIISGNGRLGIYLLGGTVVEDNIIQGNYIGTNAAGTVAIPNAEHGVHIAQALAANNTIGGTVSGAGNLISGNTLAGIDVEDDGGNETIAGNIIGLNAAGTAALGNGWPGIRMNSDNNTIGGTTSASRNVISGNPQGIVLFGTSTGNTFKNNYVGTDAAGTSAIGNTNEGIYVTDASTGNFFGVASYGNIISGNGTRALWINGDTTDSNSIQANIIGLGANGSTAIPNAGGLVIVDADGTTIGTANTSSARNIIASTSGESGIWLSGSVTGTTVVNNYVGLASDGATQRTNSVDGIRIENTAASNTVGGTATGAGNTIAAASGNNCTNVVTDAGNFNKIQRNSCVNESGTILNILRSGTSNESLATPAVTALTASTSYVAGTSSTASGALDIFVNGSYSTSVTTDGSGAWFKAMSIPSGAGVSASVTNETNSTSATTTPQVVVFDDVTAPTTLTLDPADNDTNVSVTTTLTATFSEPVVIGTGNILIKRASGDLTIDTIDVTDGSKVTGSGTNTILITPSITLSGSTEYAIQIAATALDDYAGVSYAGIADLTTWSFRTESTDDGSHGSDPTWDAEKTLTITSPDENTVVAGGSTLYVDWDSTGVIPYVSIYISTNDGDTWTAARTNISNTESTTITVPDVATTQARVKIEGTDLITTLASDQSSAFTIASLSGGSSSSGDDDTGSGEPIDGADVEEGMLIKLADDGDETTQQDSELYFIGHDGDRHAFPNAKAYFTWYENYDEVRIISAEDLAQIHLGSNVTYKPALRLVKFQSMHDVYVVERLHTLRHIPTETMAAEIYGEDWVEDIDDISDVFYTNYLFGGDLIEAADYDLTSFGDIVDINDVL